MTVSLPEGSTIADLASILNLPEDEIKVTFVNGRSRSSETGLADGDRVGFFPPVGGG